MAPARSARAGAFLVRTVFAAGRYAAGYLAATPWRWKRLCDGKPFVHCQRAIRDFARTSKSSAGTQPARTPRRGSASRRRARGKQRAAFLLGLLTAAERPTGHCAAGARERRTRPAPRQASSRLSDTCGLNRVPARFRNPALLRKAPAARDAAVSLRSRTKPRRSGAGGPEPRFSQTASERTTPGAVPGSFFRNE